MRSSTSRTDRDAVGGTSIGRPGHAECGGHGNNHPRDYMGIATALAFDHVGLGRISTSKHVSSVSVYHSKAAGMGPWRYMSVDVERGGRRVPRATPPSRRRHVWSPASLGLGGVLLILADPDLLQL